MKRRVALGCGLALLGLVAVPARGQELVAGWEGDGARRGYAFLSPAVAVGLDARHAIVVRGAASYLYYDFPEGGGRTAVVSPGASAGLGYRWRGARLSVTLAAGAERRWKEARLSGGTALAVAEAGFTGQAEVFWQATPLTNVNAIASYGHANRYLWSRAGIVRQVTSTRSEAPVAVALGLEVTVQGNDEVGTLQGGAVLALNALGRPASFQVRGGYARARYRGASAEPAAYFGATLYRAF